MLIADATDASLSEREPRSASLETRIEAYIGCDGVLGALIEIVVTSSRPIALGLLLALGGCAHDPIEVQGVVRDGRTGEPIAGAIVDAEEGRSVETDAAGRFTMQIAEGDRVSAHAAGRCPAETTAEDRRLTLNLFDRLELVDRHTQVGFDSEVRVEVRARCDRDAELAWRQTGGPELGSRMRTEHRGHVLIVRTHPLEASALDDRIGVVALDRDQRGDYQLEVSAELDGRTERRTVRVIAAPTSAGLYQVPTGTDMFLNGGSGSEHSWTLLDHPRGSTARIDHANERIARLRPDRFGTYVIEHRPSGAQMNVQAGAYEEVPRDCGREGCHATETVGWETTAHARTFRRGLEGELGPDFEERCWACHATGVDPGIDNGGLHHTAAQIGWEQPSPDAGVWEAAPRRIRRHGSVWCSACHGPGRIVPPQFRWQYGAKFQVGVCARCHDVDPGDPDANHVSPEVDEWSLAPMSQFTRALRDDDPALRRGCAQCHSAQGFVAWRRGREDVPERATVAPITCPACHDAHDARNPFALRVYDTSDPIDGSPVSDLGSGALCASCHRAGVAWEGERDASPHAPQADMLVGRGARLVAPLENGVHRFLTDSCVRCHMTRPSERDPMRGRVGGHTFAVPTGAGDADVMLAACAPCHGRTVPRELARDWDGDGQPGSVSVEYGRALSAVRARAGASIAARAVRDRCEPARTATYFGEHDARLVLIEAGGHFLGDCNANDRFDENETPITIAALPTRLADAAYDLFMLEKDGSAGVHNPEYAFRLLGAVARACPEP